MNTKENAGSLEETVVRLRPSSGDDTSAIREALQSMPLHQACRLMLEKGEYNFHDESGSETFCFVSNNSAGLKRIAFPLIGRKNLTIDGQGSHLVFHGRICPFLVRDCENLTIRDVSVDYSRPFVSEGVIETVKPGGLHIRLEDHYPYFLTGGRIWFNGERYSQRGLDQGKLYKRDSFLHCLEFDAIRRETAYMARDYFRVPASSFMEIEKGLLDIAFEFDGPPASVGNILVVSHDHRDCFGILIDQSREVKIEGVVLHHVGAMGIIAQRSDTITVKGCTVAPSEKSKRMVSSFADASHFVNCKGQIRVLDCRFENMLDDPVNVHGIYSPIRRVLDPYTLEIGNGHFEQAGIQAVDVDTGIRFIDRQSQLALGESEVKRVEPINSYLWRIELKQPFNDGIQVGDCIESLHWVPDLEIRDCRFGKNRARGPLISTGGEVVVENNHFHHAGSAIKISGDTNSWFESGAVHNVMIRGNTFENCGYGIWGNGIIAIDPEIESAGFRPEAYHRNVQIVDNAFNTFHEELVFARCVDGLTIRDNRITKTAAYPARDIAFTGLGTENCRNVDSQF